MNTTDPIADMLTRIRNANSSKHKTVDVPASNMKKAIALFLFLVLFSKSVATALPVEKACDYDYDLMAKTVYGEARGESFLGRKAIVDVIRNRMTSYRLTSKEVITRRGYNKSTKRYEYAFEGVNVEVKDKKLFETIRSEITLYLNLDDITDGAKYFYEPTLVQGYQKEIREGINKLQIGNHNFHNDFND